MSIKTIIHDIDMCHLDWQTPWMKWMHEHKGLKSKQTPEEADCYKYSNAYPDLSASQISDLIREFNASEHFNNLPPIAGAPDAFKRIREEHPTLRHFALTSSGDHPQTVAMRQKQFSDLGFSEAYILPLGGDKSPYFKKFGKSAIVIEDSPSNVMKAHAAGCATIVVDCGYNRSIPSCIAHRLHDWNDAPALITRLIQERHLEATKSKSRFADAR